jgi:hypothetical protein
VGERNGNFKKMVVLKVFLILSIVLTACGEIAFTPDITPLIVGTLETPTFLQTPEGLTTEISPAIVDQLTSDEAIELCNDKEYYGDEAMGSCLAPGGDTYLCMDSKQ